MENNNSLIDKISFYVFMSSLVLGLIMSAVFIIKANLEDNNAPANAVAETEIQVEAAPEETATTATFFVDSKVKEVATTFDSELSNPFLYEDITAIEQSFKNNTNAIIITDQLVTFYDESPDFVVFETKVGDKSLYYIMHNNGTDNVAKAKKMNLQQRTKPTEAKSSVG